MLKCQQVVAQADEYVDGEMRWQQRLAFRLHILMCSRCRTFVDNFQKMLSLLHDVSAGEPPLEVVARLEKRVCQQLADKHADRG